VRSPQSAESEVRFGAPQPRNQGVRLDAGALDRQLALRGISARQLATLSGVAENTISQARRGHRRISEATLRKLTQGLLACPLMLGAELIIGTGAAVPRDAA
jgi:transcriptional regulator with XRE-family HTH domain